MWLRRLHSLALHNAPAGATDGWCYHSFAELILEEGRVFQPGSPNDPDPVPAEWRGPAGECYAAATAWSVGADVVYVEGFAAGDSMLTASGVEHAWCADQHGTALDPTWTHGHGAAYIGIPVLSAFRRRHPEPTLLWRSSGLELLRTGIPDIAHRCRPPHADRHPNQVPLIIMSAESLESTQQTIPTPLPDHRGDATTSSCGRITPPASFPRAYSHRNS